MAESAVDSGKKTNMKRFLTVFLTICLCVVPFLASQAENNGVYVLMNIPYEAFYASEVTVGSGLDAVSSSTLMKSRTGTLSGGSYHVDPEGSDISGEWILM